MMMKQKRGAGRERGQSMVEFALVLPVVLLLIFGLLEFGRVINAEITAGHCANELARYGIVQARSVDDIKDYAFDTPVCPTFNLDPATNPDAELIIEVNVAYPAGEGTGQSITVEINYPIDIVVPIISGFFPGGVYTAHGRSELQMEAFVAPG